ncbi:heterokaryon incompatibility protein-domain-containing protein [Ilyonectria destructans]|nr:heterokaryon incompatibility protein-domain-containing protein [Ilyonectria destructans]
MLCQECKAVFNQPVALVQKKWQLDRWEAQFEYDITLSGLEGKAARCYGCRGILRQLIKHRRLEMPATAPLQILYILAAQTDEQKGSTYLWNGAISEGKKLGVQVMHFEKVSNAGQEHKVTSTNTGSTAALGFFKGCLNECRAKHSTCSSTMSSAQPWYPTRLIHVQQHSVKLVESIQGGLSGPYASLSHCWGGAKILKLEKQTLSQFKDEIPFDQLPQTFQDAIQVVRCLDINYFWIDSLCIIQDSDEDWQREAVTMLKVYKHALCNIAATRSVNSFGGLFADRNPAVLSSDVLDIDNGALKGRFRLIDEDYFTQQIDDAQLNRRAWVAQERLLSPRIIHFTSDQVIWDCAELTACESLPRGTSVWPSSARTQMRVGCKQGSHFLTPPDSADQAISQWARIVNAYSACGLTQIGDKLIAISGVAEHLQNELGLEYCAGLWRPKMEIQLSWYVKELQHGKSARNELAPSWSWVSINGSVDTQQVDAYEGYDITPLAFVTEVSTRREVYEPRGEKIVGYLRMRCSLNPVKVQGSEQEFHLEGKGMEHAKNVWVDSADVIGADRLFFVPMFDLQTPLSLEDKWNLASEIRGIIVQAVSGELGTYTRCGHAFVSASVREDTKAFDPTYDALKSSEANPGLPCEEYDCASGYVIKLV